MLTVIRKAAPIVLLIVVVLGGLYGGFLNPTDLVKPVSASGGRQASGQ